MILIYPVSLRLYKCKFTFSLSDYCFTDSSEEPEVNAWIGPAGTVSSLHTDNKYNIFAQIRGSKYFILADPKYSTEIPTVNKTMFNSSQLDVEKDIERADSAITYDDAILQEGDVIFIPKLYWHYVRSLSASVSLSIWFD